MSFIQTKYHETEKYALLTIIVNGIQHSTVIVDPLIYIIYHEKYRNAIKSCVQEMYDCMTEKIDVLASTKSSENNTTKSTTT